tara:strand:- start:1898 stop:2140 length:243 start_codon:yes stop_codon:yes gene_type:complete
VSSDDYQYCVGDIVIEKDFITIGDGTQMKGIVVAVERLSYNFGEAMQHDRVTIHWFNSDSIEEMPAVLIDLISAVKKIDE